MIVPDTRHLDLVLEMTRVKVCGLTNLEDALHAARCGASMLGFLFAESPRRVEPAKVRSIVEAIRAEGFEALPIAGVFVNAPVGEIISTAVEAELNVAQMHGNEPPDDVLAVTRFGTSVIKAFRIRDRESVEEMNRYFAADYFLCDTYDPNRAGGTGKTFDHSLVENLSRSYQLILAGGLNPENVAEAIRQVRPWGVDVSSGVEAEPGRKDPAKVEAFIKAVMGEGP